MAPINLPDGTEVSEVILPDGAAASEVIAPDGSTVFSAIPDSAVAQYDATKISATDGDALSSWADQINGNDLSAVNAPTYRASAINGNPAAEFDGADDEMTAAIGTFSQPVTYGIVYSFTSSSGTQNILDRQSGSLQYRADFANSRFDHFDGSNGFKGGTPTTNNEIGFLIWDGPNTQQFINGSEVSLSTQSSSTDLTDLQVGNNAFDEFFSGYAGEIVVYNDALSASERSSEETRLSDKWGIGV